MLCSSAFAGVERYVLTASVGLAERGHRLSVIGGKPDRFAPALSAVGAEWLPGGSIAEARRSFGKLGSADILNTHMTDADLLGVWVAPRSVPVVSTRHFAAKRGSSVLSRWISSSIPKRLAGQISVSNYVARNVEGSSTVIQSGIPEVLYESEQRETLVLVAQRLEPEKQTETALQAWARSGAACSGWRLIIAGEGTCREALEQSCSDLGIVDSVSFLGFVTDMAELFRRSSILLAPTPREGLGLSVIEAMAFGLPVIAAGGGGHLETVGSVPDAALFEPGNASDAAHLLMLLIHDKNLRYRYGAQLRHRQREKFTLHRQIEQTLRFYSETKER